MATNGLLPAATGTIQPNLTPPSGQAGDGLKFTWWCPRMSHQGADKVFSPTFSVGGRTWRLVMHPHNKGHLSLYLKAVDMRLPPWQQTARSVFAIFELTLVHQQDNKKCWVRESKTTFTSKVYKWGHSKALREDEVYDPQQGWLTDDTLEMRVHIKSVVWQPVPIDAASTTVNTLDRMKMYKLSFEDTTLKSNWQSNVLLSVSELLTQLGELQAKSQMGTRYIQYYSVRTMELAVHYQQLYSAVLYQAGLSAVRQVLTDQFKLQLSQPTAGNDIATLAKEATAKCDITVDAHNTPSEVQAERASDQDTAVGALSGKKAEEGCGKNLVASAGSTNVRMHLSLLHMDEHMDSCAPHVLVQLAATAAPEGQDAAQHFLPVPSDIDDDNTDAVSLKMMLVDAKEDTTYMMSENDAEILPAHGNLEPCADEQQLTSQMAALSIVESQVPHAVAAPADEISSIDSDDDWEKVDAGTICSV